MGRLAGLQAAWLLARGRADGADLLDAPPRDAMAAAARSFWAAPLCLPAFLCLHLIARMQAELGAYTAAELATDLLGFAVGWAAFAVVSHTLAVRLGRAALWPRFITAWNWCNLLQYLMMVVASLPSLFGLPDLVVQTIWLVAIGWAIWLEWFAARLTLVVPGMTAAALVALDVSIGLMLAGFMN